MTAVGNSGIQPDQFGSLSKLISAKSGLIGLRQQEQALQTGQYTQASAQAISQQDQQKNNEYQAAQKLALTGAQSGKYNNPDGSLNRQQMADDISTVAPTYGQGISSTLLSQANEIVSNKQALQTLNEDQQKQVGSALGALATDPDLDHSKVIDTLTALSERNPQLSRLTHSWSGGIPPNATGDQLRQAMQQAALSVTSPESAVTASTPEQGSNAAGQNQNVNRLTGARSNPALSGGATNPTSPQVAGQTIGQTGTAGSDVDRANQVSALQQQSAAAIPLTHRIDELSHEINSGHLAKMISESGNYLGFSSLNEARSQLNKDLGQVKALAIQNAGSDSRAATVLEGYPTDTTPENTTHAAMDYIRGTARQNLARGQLLQQFQKKGPGSQGFQQADAAMTSSSNPLMHEFMALSPKEQAGFYRRNFSTPQAAQEFKNQVNALKNNGH